MAQGGYSGLPPEKKDKMSKSEKLTQDVDFKKVKCTDTEAALEYSLGMFKNPAEQQFEAMQKRLQEQKLINEDLISVLKTLSDIIQENKRLRKAAEKDETNRFD